MTSYTFISYEKADATPAGELCALLEEGGLTCWIAPRDIPPGASYAATLYNGVAEASALVLLLSATTNDSPHVLREVELAVSKRPPIPIITVRLDTSDPSPDFKYHLTSLQWIEAAGRPLTDWGAVVARVLVARLGPGVRPADPVEAPVPPEPPAAPEPPVIVPPVAETPVVEAPVVEAPAVAAPVLVETTPDPEPADDPVPVVAPVVVVAPPPPRPRPSAATPKRDRPERKPPSRWSSRPVVFGAIAVLAAAGVGAALALGGGGDSGDKAAAGTTTTASASAASATTAATSVATSAPTTTNAAVLHTSDNPKAGWAPSSAKDLFAFAHTPQDGIVDYSFPAAHQDFTVVVHGSDLIVDVRYATGGTSRIWTRYAGTRLVNACVFRRDARTRCGTTANALNLTPDAFKTLTRQRTGYYDALVSLPDLRPLKTTGSVGEVTIDDGLGFAVRCAEPAGSAKLRLCIQENGFVTEMRSGTSRIRATSVTLGSSAASLKQPV